MNSTSENETNICVSAMEKLVDLATSQGKIIMSEFNIKQLETHIVASQVSKSKATQEQCSCNYHCVTILVVIIVKIIFIRSILF